MIDLLILDDLMKEQKIKSENQIFIYQEIPNYSSILQKNKEEQLEINQIEIIQL